MCGIVGFVGKNDPLLKQATDSLAHRGPDAAGYWSDGTVSLGHRRLSIIDLDARSNQPFHYKHLHITFNGEIYNFLELKQQLGGHKFVTNSDTELILHAYEAWGTDCVKRFEGMWAFAIYDTKRNQVFISRDRIGIKPLYYSTGRNFVFASELKAIKTILPEQEISTQAVNYFFYQKYIGKDLSIYREVKKLLPGHNLLYSISDRTFAIQPYYKIGTDTSANISTEELEERLKHAVNERLLADVEVGSFLSGGLDSSLISALIKKEKSNLRTFSIGFKQQSYNELEFSELVAKHIHSEHITEVQTIDDSFIEESLRYIDEPFGDASYIPTRLLSKITRKHVTVALSGDGADEIFGGYDTYFAHLLTRFYPSFLHPVLKPLVSRLPEPNRKVSKVLMAKRFFRTYSDDALKRHRDWMATFPDLERKELLGEAFIPESEFNFQSGEKNNLQEVQLEDVRNYMVEDILKKVDWASMSNSLEVRVPFLSPKVLEAGLNLPDYRKLNFSNRKIALKQIAKQHIPERILNRKKRGFTSPLKTWFQESELLKEYTLSENYFNHGFFSPKTVETFFNQNQGHYDFGRELWLCFVFNFWHKHHFTPNR